MPDPREPIPQPEFFTNGPRPCQTFAHSKNGVLTGLIVIFLDTFEHRIYGDATGAAEAVWTALGDKGREMIQRVRIAEQKVADMERGAMLGYRAELRSRLGELRARMVAADPNDPTQPWVFNLTLAGAIERLEQELGLT